MGDGEGSERITQPLDARAGLESNGNEGIRQLIWLPGTSIVYRASVESLPLRGSWTSNDEALQSGIAAMIAVAGVVFSPIGRSWKSCPFDFDESLTSSLDGQNSGRHALRDA